MSNQLVKFFLFPFSFFLLIAMFLSCEDELVSEERGSEDRSSQADLCTGLNDTDAVEGMWFANDDPP